MTVCLCVPAHIVNIHSFDRMIFIGNFEKINLIYYIDRVIWMDAIILIGNMVDGLRILG